MTPNNATYKITYRAEIDSNTPCIYWVKTNLRFNPEYMANLLSKVFWNPTVQPVAEGEVVDRYFDPMIGLYSSQEKLSSGIDTLSKRQKALLIERINTFKQIDDYMLDTCVDIERTDYAKYKERRKKREEESESSLYIGDDYGVGAVSTSSITASAFYWHPDTTYIARDSGADGFGDVEDVI